MRVAIEGLHAGYGTATIIDGLGLVLDEGEAVAIVGRNGMGKTTFVKAILGYLERCSGSVRLGGHLVSGWPTHRIIRLGVGYAPQEGHVFGELSVSDNLDVGGRSRRAAEARRRELLELFPVLGRRLRQHAGTLSGGEQKMLVLARALMSRSSLLVLDEISDGLQPAMISRVEEALHAERQRGDVTLIMIEQNLDLSIAVADRIAVMKLGQLVFESSSKRHAVRDELAARLAPRSS